ncbi:MAG TPA: nuclear transport factor 2 family protein [Solirubrobacteraceae bacterium]|nr:nuclear transport factor 2 family protein [Solirubrobacteraceae bacterium]
MSNAEDFTRIANELKQAADSGDLDALRNVYATDAVIWHNVDDTEKTVEESLKFLGALRAVTTRTWYADQRLTLTENGFVLQHYTGAELKSGEELSIPSALIVTVKDGKISRLEEYIESNAAAPAFAALAALSQAAE